MDIQSDLLSSVQHLHFVGIGGSGMCPLAEILLSRGFHITGSDISESDTLDRIRSYGIEVSMGHRAENIKGAELVVYTAAVKQDNPELVAAREQGIPLVERSVMLGMVCRRYKDSIAVSGTHGKTTTTAMITQILINGGKDPSAIIGGKLPFIGGNGRVGNNGIIVCEACEYVDTFLQLTPAVSVILNVDGDHLDYFGTVENIIKSFHQFATQTSGTVFVNGEDTNSMKSVEGIEAKVITFGLDAKCDYYAENIKDCAGARESFTLMKQGKALAEIDLSVPGRHNIYNAVAAAAVADFMGVTADKIASSLHEFKGVHRRFEILGKPNGIVIADDFAHHPTELKATLSAAKRMGFNRVWAVFQPHTYSRTYMLLDQFAEALKIADRVVLTEILAVREENTYNIYSKDLCAKIPESVWFTTFDDIADYVYQNASEGDLVITIGGGDIYKCAHKILAKYGLE